MSIDFSHLARPFRTTIWMKFGLKLIPKTTQIRSYTALFDEFKAGILARLEDLRDAKLAIIMTMFQQRIRWYLAQGIKQIFSHALSNSLFKPMSSVASNNVLDCSSCSATSVLGALFALGIGSNFMARSRCVVRNIRALLETNTFSHCSKPERSRRRSTPSTLASRSWKKLLPRKRPSANSWRQKSPNWLRRRTRFARIEIIPLNIWLIPVVPGLGEREASCRWERGTCQQTSSSEERSRPPSRRPVWPIGMSLIPLTTCYTW